MAIDTAAKQHAMLNFWDGTTIHLLPIPIAGFGQGDMQHLLDLSIEPAFAGAPVVEAVGRSRVIYGGRSGQSR